MIRRIALTALLALFAATPSSRAQLMGGMGGGGMMGQGEAYAFYITTAEGSRIAGQLAQGPLSFHSDDVGKISIPFERIVSLEFAPGGDGRDVLRTVGNSQLVGRAEFEELEIESEFGTLKIPRGKIRMIQSYSAFVSSGGMSMGMGGMGMMMGGMGGGMTGGSTIAPGTADQPK